MLYTQALIEVRNGAFTEDVASVARIEAVGKILEVVLRSTGLGFATVARVTETRWIACAVRDEINFGLTAGSELDLQTTICKDIRRTGKAVVIDHVAASEEFSNHPTPQQYGFQSYISVPIELPDGTFFGTLCAVDIKPARLNTPETIGMFRLFADLIGMHLDAQRTMARNEAALSSERGAAQLREQFIAVLGHDLRNPLNAVNAASEAIRTLPPGREMNEYLDLIQRSVERMSDLVGNVADFARGRLGGGLRLNRGLGTDLEPKLFHVIAELGSAWPGRRIVTQLEIERPVFCDSDRVGQLLSNLLGNALNHGSPDWPVNIHARSGADGFELSVTNGCTAIAPDVLNHIFEPFVRGNHADHPGLGLGLYIAAEIARAHGGTLDVHHSDDCIRFTFSLPHV